MTSLKVSCITPTLNVLPKLKVAIECYLNQTHSNREMLILFYDHDEKTKEYLLGLSKEWCKENNIRIFHYHHESKNKLGSIINFLISKVSGEYTMIWDSDDWHHPQRIESQLNHLLLNKKISCTLDSVLIYSHRHKDIVISNKRLDTGWEQTLLCKTEYIPPYENQQSKYDTPVLCYLVDNEMNCVLEETSMYMYTIHNNANASSNKHMDKLYETGTKTKIDYTNIIKKITNE